MKYYCFIIELRENQKIIVNQTHTDEFTLTDAVFKTPLAQLAGITPTTYDMHTQEGISYFQPCKPDTFCLVVKSENQLTTVPFAIN